MSRRILLVVLACAAAALGLAGKDAPTGKDAIKSAEARRAIAAYEKAVAQAQVEYDARIDAERRKLKLALQAAQSAATRGGDLEDALRIRDYRGDADTRGELIQSLNGKTWYWHWEKERRNLPFKFTLDASGKDARWKLEQRWVLGDGQNYLIPVDDYTLRGFFIETGREVGAFADKEKDKK